MALDSAQKRASALMGGFVVPSGTLDQAERQAAAWLYSGVLAGYTAPTAEVTQYFHEIGTNRHGMFETMRFRAKIGG